MARLLDGMVSFGNRAVEQTVDSGKLADSKVYFSFDHRA